MSRSYFVTEKGAPQGGRDFRGFVVRVIHPQAKTVYLEHHHNWACRLNASLSRAKIYTMKSHASSAVNRIHKDTGWPCQWVEVSLLEAQTEGPMVGAF
jgi:hypothetical protein